MGNRLTKKLLATLLAVCMIAALMPVSVFADENVITVSNKTANFTVDNGEAAINLLNQYETDTEGSSWDSDTNTLTLNGIKFTTTAQTAVKLPAGSTIVLKDGTHNIIQSGDVDLSISGENKNQAFVNALETEGDLTIQGGTAGSGTLSVCAGKLKNSGDEWVYSSGISVDGNFTVKGGQVIARGGAVESNDSCFSIGINMDNNIKGKALQVTGGSLTAIADKAYEREEDGTKRAVFSRGVYIYQGNVTVSGNGKLRAESVKEMADATLLSNGLYISAGNLTVENSAEVSVAGGYGAYISGGNIRLEGGELHAVSTQAPDTYGNLENAVYVAADSNKVDTGNITVRGGTLETNNGKIYVSAIGATEKQGMFTVTGGTIVNRGQLYGPKKLDISGGTMQTQGIDTDALTLSGGSLTIREPVHKSLYNGELYALPALDVSNLTVNDGIMDAAWDWGKFTPIVLPKDEEYNDVGILVRMPYGFNTAAFTGGTTTLDTGKAGNTALLIKGQLTLGNGMEETGADTNHCQIKSDIPVKIAAASTTITTVDVENVKLDYQPGDAPQASAKPAGANKNKYDILFERWEKLEKNAAGILEPVAYWYSDESCYQKGDVEFTEFEKDVQYRYSIQLNAVGDYKFDGNTGLYINGGDLKSDTKTVTVSSDRKTICFEGALTITPKAFSGGGYYVPVQKPEIITGEGGKTALENSGGTLVITPDDGMQISKVTVNGNEVTVTDNKITGLKTGDKVEVTFTKIPPTKEEIDKAFKEKLLNLGLTVRTSKTAKKNIKAVVKETSELNDLIKEIKDAGYTVKYKFYRSTKKSSKYISAVTKTENTYINTTGEKGTKYYYKARLMVYDAEGNLVAQTELKQCKYGLRTWSK